MLFVSLAIQDVKKSTSIGVWCIRGCVPCPLGKVAVVFEKQSKVMNKLLFRAIVYSTQREASDSDSVEEVLSIEILL